MASPAWGQSSARFLFANSGSLSVGTCLLVDRPPVVERAPTYQCTRFPVPSVPSFRAIVGHDVLSALVKEISCNCFAGLAARGKKRSVYQPPSPERGEAEPPHFPCALPRCCPLINCCRAEELPWGWMCCIPTAETAPGWMRCPDPSALRCATLLRRAFLCHAVPLCAMLDCAVPCHAEPGGTALCCFCHLFPTKDPRVPPHRRRDGHSALPSAHPIPRTHGSGDPFPPPAPGHASPMAPCPNNPRGAGMDALRTPQH